MPSLREGGGNCWSSFSWAMAEADGRKKRLAADRPERWENTNGAESAVGVSLERGTPKRIIP